MMVAPSQERRSGSEDLWSAHSDILCCPRCGGSLRLEQGRFACEQCSHVYAASDEVPSLFTPNEWVDAKEDVTEAIKAFYETNPFPNYDDFDNAASLIDKARKGLFAKLLDDQIP